MLIYFIIFIFGLIIGSFLNVVIYRLKEMETIVNTRSHCPKCKRELAWYDLIPFLSFIILKTKCRYCGKPISWQYPLVEIGTALLFTCIYWHFGNTFLTYFLILISCFLIVIFVYDLLHYIIPNEMIWPAIILTLLYLCISPFIKLYPSTPLHLYTLSLTPALIGSAIGAGFIGLLVLITKGKGMGVGDIKLGFLLGLLNPYPYTILSLFVAFGLGALVGIFLIIFSKKSFKTAIPFGPFLIVGIFVTLFWGQKIVEWYLSLG
ncbi:MAG: prepilin peptidase [Patescibacteria group bacterium]|nr:prepilin peptidase [Patescibacteria group bacterium]